MNSLVSWLSKYYGLLLSEVSAVSLDFEFKMQLNTNEFTYKSQNKTCLNPGSSSH